MNDNKPPANWPDRAVGLGAGLASALLFAASTRGSGLALTLAYFSPLPVMIGAIGFSAPAALAGAVMGAALLAHAAQPTLGFAFLFGMGAPALIAGALVRRAFPARSGESAPLPQFFTPGALLAVLMTLAVIASWIGLAALTQAFHGFDAALDALARRFDPSLEEMVQNLKKMSPDIEADMVKRLFLLSSPALVAASQTLLLAINLWLAARVVEISGRLGRPWPALPENLALPRLVAPAFILALGVTFQGGLVGALAGAFAAASGVALAMQGLAAVHALTRDNKFRGAVLAALYAALLVLQLGPLLALTLFGLIESAFQLRARRARRLSTRS